MNIEQCFFFDIETVGTTDQGIIDLLFPEPEHKTAEDAPKNYKKEEAIQAWIEREYEKDLQAREDAVSLGALDIDTAVIKSIAWALGDEDIKCSVGTEKEMLYDFLIDWNKSGFNTKSVGFNTINYDWSVLMRRLAMLGLNNWLEKKPNMNRYSGEIDLMNVAYNFGYSAGTTKGLKTLIKIMDIEPLFEGDGSMVSGMSTEELIMYNVSDVHVIRELFRKFNGIYI